MIKKIFLSVFVIATFVIYSLHQRSEVVAVTPTVPESTKPDTSTSATTPPPSTSTAVTYKDGTYTGKAADAYYGYIQVQVVVSSGKITDVVFLEHPNDQHESVQINNQAMPLLKSQAIKAQSANVDGVSGATDTSMAFVQSAESALTQAQV